MMTYRKLMMLAAFATGAWEPLLAALKRPSSEIRVLGVMAVRSLLGAATRAHKERALAGGAPFILAAYFADASTPTSVKVAGHALGTFFSSADGEEEDPSFRASVVGEILRACSPARLATLVGKSPDVSLSSLVLLDSIVESTTGRSSHLVCPAPSSPCSRRCRAQRTQWASTRCS